MKRLFFVILIVLAACTPAATETLAPADPPTEVPTQIPPTEIPPTAVPPTAIPTPEPPTPVPTPFAVDLEMIFAGVKVYFNAPNNMTCDLFVLSDFPNILSTDPITCLPSSPINNILWGKLMDENEKIIPLKKYKDVLDFLDDFLQADVYATNEMGFGIDPQDEVGQQYALFELNMNNDTYTIILWLNAVEAQAEIIATSEVEDESNEDIWTPPTAIND